MSTRRAVLVAMSVVALAAAASGGRQQPVVRERRRVVVGADTEEWRLEWKSPPREVCSPNDGGFAFARPCTGWAFGEAGHLVLIRQRRGALDERFELDSFFEETPTGGAVLQRWPTELWDFPGSFDAGPLPDSVSRRIRSRPVVMVMRLGDYDHDGRATEFVLEVEPYRTGSVLVGLSVKNPTLHVFGSALHSNSRLMLGPGQWDDLLQSPDGHVMTNNLLCGDHGSEEAEDVELRTSPDGIHATLYTYACDEHFNKGALKSKKEF